MDKTALQQIIDGLVSFAENRFNNPMVTAFLEMLRKEIDAVGLDYVLGFLKSKGVNVKE